MKKNYITTFQNADNYGAMLQCYALSNFLKDFNDTYVINYNNELLAEQYKIIRKIDKNPIKSAYHLVIDLLNYSDALKRCKNFNNFRKGIQFTKKIDCLEELNYDADSIFITGSDQVWNPIIAGRIDDVYFLNLKNKYYKKISYAASCGDISTLKNFQNDFFESIKSFDNISVREKGLCDFINSNSNLCSEVVLDPTLLLDVKDWKKIIDDKRIIEDKYIFVYSVGNANELFNKSVDKISKLTGLKIVFFDKKKLSCEFKVKKERWYKAGPLEFLNLLYYSEYVVTTSFHGTALSTIFNKSLFVILSSYPDRLLTLLNEISLNSRIVKCEDDIERILNTTTDWKKVNDSLGKKRKESQNWIKEAIK